MGSCCSTDGVPGGGDYRPRRTAAYEVSSEVSSLNSQQLKQFDRLSRPETIKGVYGQESSPFAESLARKMKLLKASITDGINEDPEQFQSEIKESIPELRHFERRRIREWIDLVIEMNKEHVARRVAEELNKAALDLTQNNNNGENNNNSNLNKNHQRSTSSISDMNNNTTNSKNTSGNSNFHFRQASDTSIFSLTTKSNANSGSLQGSNKLGLIPIVHRNSPQQIHRRNDSRISDKNDDDDDNEHDYPRNGTHSINQTLEGKDDCASKTATHHSAADAGSLDNEECCARTNSYNSSGAGPVRNKNSNKKRTTVEAGGDSENDDDNDCDEQKSKLRLVAASSVDDLQDASTSSARQNGSLTPSAAATKNDDDTNNGFSTTHHHTESKANNKPGKSLAVTPQLGTTPGEVSSTSIDNNNNNNITNTDDNSPTNDEISGGAANKNNNNSNRTPATTDFTPIVTVVDCKASPITTVTIKRQLLPTDPEVVKIVSKMTKHQRLSKMFYPIPKKMKKRATSPKDAALPAWLTP